MSTSHATKAFDTCVFSGRLRALFPEIQAFCRTITDKVSKLFGPNFPVFPSQRRKFSSIPFRSPPCDYFMNLLRSEQQLQALTHLTKKEDPCFFPLRKGAQNSLANWAHPEARA
jgi:hypothetical protein